MDILRILNKKHSDSINYSPTHPALETCPAHLRGAVGMGIGLPYSLGVMLFGGFGYLLRSWRHLYMVTSFPAFLMLPVSL